jgi:hypothetical protein
VMGTLGAQGSDVGAGPLSPGTCDTECTRTKSTVLTCWLCWFSSLPVGGRLARPVLGARRPELSRPVRNSESCWSSEWLPRTEVVSQAMSATLVPKMPCGEAGMLADGAAAEACARGRLCSGSSGTAGGCGGPPCGAPLDVAAGGPWPPEWPGARIAAATASLDKGRPGVSRGAPLCSLVSCLGVLAPLPLMLRSMVTVDCGVCCGVSPLREGVAGGVDVEQCPGGPIPHAAAMSVAASSPAAAAAPSALRWRFKLCACRHAVCLPPAKIQGFSHIVHRLAGRLRL